MEKQAILYQDKHVKITNEFVEIKCYYFPFGNNKKIPVREIKNVQIRDLGWAKGRLWGMDASHWGFWLAGDRHRYRQQQFIALYTESSIKPSFSAINVVQVFNIIRKLINQQMQKKVNPTQTKLEQRNQYVQKQSEQANLIKQD